MKILIINYYWPPSGGSVVQRWLYFACALPEFKITPFILTVDENKATYPSKDTSLLEQIPKELKIYKTNTKELFWFYKKFIGGGKVPSAAFANESDPNSLQKLSRFIRGNFFIPDPRKGWNRFAIKKAEEIIQKENISTIATCGPPHSTHLIGLYLKNKYKINWIVDFHDMWTDVIYYDKFFHTSFSKKKDEGLERKILESSDVILTVGKKYKEKLLSKSNLIPDNKIKIITMGYDEKDFVYISKPSNNEFIITYTGTIADYYHPEVFLKALKNVTEKNPGINYKIRFVGILASRIKDNILNLGLERNLEEIGYVSHDKSIQYLMNSTILLLVNPVVKNDDMVIPGKLYEYLASRKPIINISTLKSEAASIINECEAGKTFSRNMENELIEYLFSLSDRWKVNPNLDLGEKNIQYKNYSRHNEAKKLSNIILELG